MPFLHVLTPFYYGKIFLRKSQAFFMDREQQMSEQIKQLKEYLEQAERIVFLGGAGVSTESGIPDFRSAQGLYQREKALSAEEILSHSYFEREPEAFFAFYRTHMLYPQAESNLAHRMLARWERKGRLLAVVTQNIDGLHQKAGSKRVFELHGSVYRNHCLRCGKAYGVEFILNTQGIPHCPSCGGMIKPDVVLYEEMLDETVLAGAISVISKADLLIVGGTSLNVYPAAGLIHYQQAGKLILLNQSRTEMDHYADLVIHDSLGNIFSQLQEEMR